MDLITREQNESPRDFIERLAEDNKWFYGSTRGQAAINSFEQTFPCSWIYVAELIQNAIDEKATILSFIIHDENTLIFEHNGNHFDFENDVTGLCTRGLSTKGAGTVGFMGIGFKSVFGSYQRVNVSSGEWSFYLQVTLDNDNYREWVGLTCPIWDDTIKKPSEGMTCRFELKNRCIENRSIASDLIEVAQNDYSLLPMLATQGVQTFILNDIVWKLSIAEKIPFEDDSGARIRVEARTNEENESLSWMIFSQKYSPSEDAVRLFRKHRRLKKTEQNDFETRRQRRVEAFFALNEQGFPIFPDSAEVFALLPTEISLPIGVHIQADWLLTQSRQELMDASSIWHREIIMNIPKIIKQYFRWLVSDDGPSEGDWKNMHQILPPLDKKTLGTFSWFFCGDKNNPIKTSPFLNALREELINEKILPTHLSDSTIGFETPTYARLLPKSINDNCGFEDMLPWQLFGEEKAVYTEFIQKASDTLSKLDLLTELTAEELENWWGDDRVKIWYECFPEQERFTKLTSVLAGLAPLDVNPAWASAKLPCIPSENGLFITREDATLYPSDWKDISNDENLFVIMKIMLAEDDSLIDWEYQKHVQSFRTEAANYLKKVKQNDLVSYTHAWWNSRPTEHLDSDSISTIIQFTHLVCKNHPEKQNLIEKILCENVNGSLQLRSLQETLLADPYAESYRRLYFPDLPRVSPQYYDYDSTLDWQAFFESCSPKPQGKLLLYYLRTTMNRWELSESYNRPLPDQRSTYLRIRLFNNEEISNNDFGIFDFSFSNKLKQSMFEEHNESQLKNLSAWLSENISYLEKYKNVHIYYIPYFSSDEKLLENDWVPEWIKLLRDIPWLYSSDNRGPFRPADILAAYDAARPDAPVVASISERLVRIFEKHNIIFGSAIPKPGPLRELQVHGGTWPVEKIAEVIAEILESSATTEDEKQTLTNILMTEPMIPLPKEVRLVDRSTRVSIQRIVKRAGQKNRSDLGWVVAEQELRTNPEHDQFFALIESIISTPEQLTGDQIIDFLQWIWETEPESELVRKALPLAYAYIIEDRAKNPSIEERWSSVIEDAKVFTLGGNWVKTSDEVGVFFDDIGFSNYSVIPKARRVTPTHLGPNNKPDNQKTSAELLNVRLVSDKFEIVPIEGDHLPLPSEWAQNFSVLYAVLAELLRQNKSTDDDEDDAETPVESVAPPDKRTSLTLKLVTKLENVTRNKKTAEIIDRKALAATLEGSVAIVSGEPDDFADELCILVFQYFDAARRQNLLPITNQVTLLLSHIDDKKFLERLNKFTKKHGLKDVKQLVKAAATEEELPADEAPVLAESALTKPSGVLSLLEEFEEDDADFDNPSDDILADDTDDLDIDDVLGFYENGSNLKKAESTQPLSSPHKESSTPSSFAAKSHTGKNVHRSDAKSTEAAPPVKPGRGKASSESHTHSPSNRRLLSYVQNANHESANDHLNEAENENETLVVGRAGEMAAMDFERQRGWTPTKMPHNNPGYDIESIGPNGEKIYIEVKGVSGEWSESGVAVSATQFEFAQQNPESTWLYVVENVGISGKERIYPILNPAKQVTEFRFDSGWKSVAQTMQQSSSSANSVEVGSRVRDLNGDSRTGTITEVTARGKFLLVKILFDDDTESQTLFTPDRFELI